MMDVTPSMYEAIGEKAKLRKALFTKYVDENFANTNVVSPTQYITLIKEHFEYLLGDLRFLNEEATDAFAVYPILGPKQNARKQKVKALGDACIDARNKVEKVFVKMYQTIMDVFPRVKWDMEEKGMPRDELRKELEARHLAIGGFLRNNIMGNYKPGITDVYNSLAHGIVKNSSPADILRWARNPDTGKRASDEPVGGPPSKKPRKHIDAGVWWGPNNSKLTSGEMFMQVISSYKRYIAQGSYSLHNKDHFDSMRDFLKMALRALNFPSSKLDELLLESEWEFTDFSLDVPVPTFLDPVAQPAFWRTGSQKTLGLDHFKTKVLGGGLAANESPSQVPTVTANKAIGITTKSTSVSLRGGASGDTPKKNRTRKDQRRARDNTRIQRWSIDLLFKQAQEDQLLKTVDFIARVDDVVPPMLEPEHVGGSILNALKKTFKGVADSVVWTNIHDINDTVTLQHAANTCLSSSQQHTSEARDFLYNNPKINTEAPMFPEAEIGGRRIERYPGNYRDGDFVEPLGKVFKARVTQLYRLRIYWKLYLMQAISLKDLLLEERRNLATWDLHEEMFMEWENNRWYSLRSPLEKRALRTRYEARELLRTRWAGVVAHIDEVTAQLDHQPMKYYDVTQDSSDYENLKPGIHAITPPLSEEGNTLVDPQGDVEMLDQNKDDIDMSGIHTKEDVIEIEDDEDNTDHNNDGKVVSIDDKKALALEFLRKTRKVYNDKLTSLIQRNDSLDNEDPGNHATIQKLNIEIMSLNQTIWSFDVEIHNLQRSMEPLASGNYGRGAEHNFYSLEPENTWRYTRTIPKKHPLPLGVKSLGPGPLPGEHPTAQHPRVLVGAPANFGAAAHPSEDDVKTASEGMPTQEVDHQARTSMNFTAGKDKMAAAPGVRTAAGKGMPPTEAVHLSATAGVKIPLRIGHIPSEWPLLIQMHIASRQKTQPSGTAALSWDEWNMAVYRALDQSTRDFAQYFSERSVYHVGGEPLRLHVNDVYRKQFNNNSFDHNSMTWQQREMQRNQILGTLAAEVNQALAAKNIPEKFVTPERLPTTTSSTTAKSDNTARSDTLNQIRGIIGQKNQAETMIRELQRQKEEGSLSSEQSTKLQRAQMYRRLQLESLKRVQDNADATTRAQAILLIQEEEDRVKAQQKMDEAERRQRMNKSEDNEALGNQRSRNITTQQTSAGGRLADMYQQQVDQQQKLDMARQRQQLEQARQRQQQQLDMARQRRRQQQQQQQQQLQLQTQKRKQESVQPKVVEPTQQSAKEAEVDWKIENLKYQKMAIPQIEKAIKEGERSLEVLRRNAIQAEEKGDKAATLEAARARHEAEVYLEILREELAAFRDRFLVVLKPDILRRGYDILNLDIDEWRLTQKWMPGEDTVENVYRRWALEATAWLHEELKAELVDPGVAQWPNLYSTIWEYQQGRTLEEQRRGSLVAVVKTLWAGYETRAPSSKQLEPSIMKPDETQDMSSLKPTNKRMLLEQAAKTWVMNTKPAPTKQEPTKATPTKQQPTESAPTEPMETEPASTIPAPTPTTPELPADMSEYTYNVTASDGEGKFPGYENTDAWPDLMELLQATWVSKLAYNALRQREGEPAKGTNGSILKGQPGFPAPIQGSAEYAEL